MQKAFILESKTEKRLILLLEELIWMEALPHPPTPITSPQKTMDNGLLMEIGIFS